MLNAITNNFTELKTKAASPIIKLIIFQIWGMFSVDVQLQKEPLIAITE
jgi:hypothetical protein